MNNVYLAARYSWKDEMVIHAEQLTASGFGVTSRWIFGDGESLASREAANMDLNNIDQADTLIMFTAPHGEGIGRHIELGYALALKKKVYVVGNAESIFHWVEGVTVVKNLEEVIQLESV